MEYAIIDINPNIEYARPGDDLVGIVDAPDANTAIVVAFGVDWCEDRWDETDAKIVDAPDANTAILAAYVVDCFGITYAAVTIDEMVAWIEDCGESTEDRSATEIVDAVAFNYAGSLRGFVRDGVPA